MTRIVTLATARLSSLPDSLTSGIDAAVANTAIVDAYLKDGKAAAAEIQQQLLRSIDLPGIHAARRKNILEQMEIAVEQGADLLVLPEATDTPFFANLCLTDPEAIRFFCKQEAAEGIDELIAFSKKHGLTFLYNYAKDAEGKFFNTTAVFQNGELVDEAQKCHLPGEAEPRLPVRTQYEKMIFTAGEDYTTFDLETRGGVRYRLGIALCQERRHPELFMALNAREVDVVAIPYSVGMAAFEDPQLFKGEHRGITAHAQFIGGIAQFFHMHLVACAKPGPNFGIPLIAGSGIWNPGGSLLTELSVEHGGSPLIACCDLDLRHIAMARAHGRLPSVPPSN